MSSMVASSVTVIGFKGGLGRSFSGGEDYPMLANSVPNVIRVGKPVRAQAMMNINDGKGLSSPLVGVTPPIVGKKRFNKIKEKIIDLHSQVINGVCKATGVDDKQRQGWIHTAKKNAEKFGLKFNK